MLQRASRSRLLAQRRYILMLARELTSPAQELRKVAAETLVATSPPPSLIAELSCDDVLVTDQALREINAFNRRWASGIKQELCETYLPYVTAMADDQPSWWNYRTWEHALATRRIFLALIDAHQCMPLNQRSEDELDALAIMYSKLMQTLPTIWRWLFGRELQHCGLDVWFHYWKKVAELDPDGARIDLCSQITDKISFVRLAAISTLNNLFRTLFDQRAPQDAVEAAWNACDMFTYSYGFPHAQRCDAEGAALIAYCRQTIRCILVLPEPDRLHFSAELTSYTATIIELHAVIPGPATEDAFQRAQAWLAVQNGTL